MRVLHVSQATRYGLHRYLADLINDQTTRGWEVVLACPPDRELAEVCGQAGAEYHEWKAEREPGLSTVREVRSLRRIIDAVAADVLQLHSSKAGLAGRLAIRGSRPTVFTPHGWSFFAGGALTRAAALRWERMATRWTDVILCVSDAEREIGESSGVRASWRVVPNAVDLTRFTPPDDDERAQARLQLGVAPSAPVAACIGRLTRQKAQDHLVKTWPAVRRAVPGAELYLVGEGSDEVTLRGLTTPGVHLAGVHADVRPWFHAADVVVQPSRWEGFSFVVLEALASGCSIVATDVAGMREAIGDGATASGAVVPIDDEAALAAAVSDRLGDPELVHRERERARDRAQAFGLDRWGDRVAEVLTEVAHRT